MVNRTLTKRIALPKVDLDLVRQYCSLDDTDNDKLLYQYISGAFDAAELKTRRFFTQSEVALNTFDDEITLKSKVDRIIEVKVGGIGTTSYKMQGNTLVFDTVSDIQVKYSTVEDVTNGVLMFVLKYVLHQLERNNPDRGELDYSDLSPYFEQ